jgi:hypothetical protein
MSRVTEDEAVHREAERVVNYLASAGELGRTTVSCAVLREIQLSMGAEMFSRGKSYDICSRPVGSPRRTGVGSQYVKHICANCGRIRTFRLVRNETYSRVAEDSGWSQRPIVCVTCGYSFTAGVFSNDHLHRPRLPRTTRPCHQAG